MRIILLLVLLFIIIIFLLFLKYKKESFITDEGQLIVEGPRGEDGESGSCGCNNLTFDEFIKIITDNNSTLIKNLINDVINEYNVDQQSDIKEYLKQIKHFTF